MTEPAAHRTFGLKAPRDLHAKLRFDIERLRAATSSDDVKYAAIDCAIDASHLADWVLAAVDDERHESLSGQKRLSIQAPAGFVRLQEQRLPALKFCREIANGAKHFSLRPRRDNISITTNSTVSIRMTFDKDLNGVVDARPYAYIFIDEGRYDVLDLFEDMFEQWLAFMKEERLSDRYSMNLSVRKKSPEELAVDRNDAGAV